jgi:carboxylesterase type B
MHKLLKAQLDTADSDTSANLGDQWLPVVDGEGGFLPAAPSTLIEEGRFGNISTMIGWCDNDAVLFTPSTVITPNDTYTQIRDYLPGMTDAHVHELLSLYPPSDFRTSHFPNGSVELHAEVYRCGRIIRDILFTCQPIHYGEAIAARGNAVYLYDQNQTMLTPALHSVGLYGLGVVHTSDLVFVFGNLSKFDVPGIPYHPSKSDFELRDQESRSWSTFAAIGEPSLEGHDTLPGWQKADFDDENFGVYVIGGPDRGFSGSTQSSPRARRVMAEEKLQERCGFLNRPDIVKELQY